MESKELAIRLARALDAKKAVNVHILEVQDLTTVTEYFVIATGMSTTHVGALADEAEFQLEREASRSCAPRARMASAGCCWTTAASSSMSLRRRPHDYYDLEHLWADAASCRPLSGCLTKVRTSSKNAERLPPRGKLSAAPTAD